jgi:cytochrome c oxidase cbb3-type subunit 3
VKMRSVASGGRKPPVKPSAVYSLNSGLTPPARLLLLVLLLAGCDLKSGQPNPKDQPKRPDQVLDFPALYSKNCSGCHGADGQLGPAPPLHDGLFLAIVSDYELSRTITEGRKNTLMPPFGQKQGGNLTPAQVQALVKGIRTTWGKTKLSVSAPLPAYLESEARQKGAQPGNPEDGAKMFRMACAGCHGETGKGVMTMTEEGESRLMPTDAGPLNDPAFLALISDQALRRIIITGRLDLNMPNFADNEDRGRRFQPLTNQAIADLVALLGSWRQPAPVPNSSQGTAQQPER